MNKVMLMGKLSFDPDFRTTQSGLAVCNLSAATMERAERKTSDQAKPHFEYHRCTAWGKTAESCKKYLKKDSFVFIEGKLRTDSYEKDGVKKTLTKIVVDNIKFLDAPKHAEEAEDVPF